MDNMNFTASERNPLVSIIVITYNSAEYVLETLASAKAQTYKNIELIISDDGSRDDTVPICRQWLEANDERFVNVKLLTVEVNTGIPANCNRGVRAANGEWIKFIAGDDILVEEAIDLLLIKCKANKEIHIISSVSQPFSIDNGVTKYTDQVTVESSFYHTSMTAAKQYNVLLYQCIIHAPNVFIKRVVFDKVGEFDEKFKLMEDYPFWLKVTKAGYMFYNLSATTVYYRVHPDSVYNKKANRKIFNDFYLAKREFEQTYIYPNISNTGKYFYELEFFRKEIFNKLGLNRGNLFLKILYYSTLRLSPLTIYTNFVKRRIYREN